MKQVIIITNLLLVSGLVLSGCATSAKTKQLCEGSKNPSCESQMSKARTACTMTAYSAAEKIKTPTGRVTCAGSGNLSNGRISNSGQVTGNVYSQTTCQPQYKETINEASYNKIYSDCLTPKVARIRAGANK